MSKLWKLTLEYVLVRDEHPLDDDNMVNALLYIEEQDQCIFVNSTAEELVAVAESDDDSDSDAPVPEVELSPEPKIELLQPVPPSLVIALRMPRDIGPYIKDRVSRVRKSSSGSMVLEYLYVSKGYIRLAKKCGMGTSSTRNKKPCVWLTVTELKYVCQADKTERQASRDRRAVAGMS